jgi:DNA-binding MarR family transcriptional regulator
MHSQDARLANLFGAAALAALDAQGQAVADAVGLPATGAAALVTIAARPGWSAERLRPAVGLSQPGMARLVDRLVAGGLVERRQGRDGREHALHVTEAGAAAAARIGEARRAALCEVLAVLDADARDAATAIFERILDARTRAPGDVERVCRLCERPACDRCPVAAAGSRL